MPPAYLEVVPLFLYEHTLLTFRKELDYQTC